MPSTNIIERANEYVAQYVKEYYQPPEDEDEMDYHDSFADSFRSKTHDFQVETCFELMDMINYCNQHSEYHNFNQDFTEVKDITSLFLSLIHDENYAE
jgi:hypothetical protein